jgi:hypothetical protein
MSVYGDDSLRKSWRGVSFLEALGNADSFSYQNLSKQPVHKTTHDVLLQPLLGGRGNGEKCMRCGLARLGVAGMSHNGGEFAG